MSRVIRLRGSKTGARVVPLELAAVEPLTAAWPTAGSPDDYVCRGEKPGAPFVGID